MRHIFILAAELYLIDGYYPLNITEEEKSDETIVKAQCFYYKQLLLMIRYCYIIEQSFIGDTSHFDQNISGELYKNLMTRLRNKYV